VDVLFVSAAPSIGRCYAISSALCLLHDRVAVRRAGLLGCWSHRHAQGFDGLAALVQTQLSEDPFSGQLFVFRGRAGDRVKILWWSGDGLCMFAKRLERGRLIWPQATHGTVSLSGAQLSMLLQGIDWRRVERTFDPHVAA
jgi:transposase